MRPDRKYPPGHFLGRGYRIIERIGSGGSGAVYKVEKVPPHPSDRNPALPRAVGDLIMRMLEKDPARRPPDACAVLTELEAARAACEAELDATFVRDRLSAPPDDSGPPESDRSTPPPPSPGTAPSSRPAPATAGRRGASRGARAS